MEYYLGIDWGEKKCGTALADQETRLAFAWKIFPNKNFEKEIEKSQKELVFCQVVLGISQGYVFSSQNLSAILAFKKKLEAAGFQVSLQEEFFSTQLAKNNLSEKRGLGKKLKTEDDAESARIILQSWLDKKKEEC